MPGTRIKRLEAEAMFEEFLRGESIQGIAKRFSRNRARVAHLALREGWVDKRNQAHAEALEDLRAKAVHMKVKRIEGKWYRWSAMSKEFIERVQAGQGTGIPADQLPAEILAIENSLVKEFTPDGPALQVNLTSNGPTAVQVIDGRPIHEWTTEELRRRVAQGEGAKRIEVADVGGHPAAGAEGAEMRRVVQGEGSEGLPSGV